MTEYFTTHPDDLIHVIGIPITFIIYLLYFTLDRYAKTNHIEITVGGVLTSVVFSFMSWILLVAFVGSAIIFGMVCFIVKAFEYKIRLK